MKGARIKFALALALFLGWLGWLAVAVADKDAAPVVSRGQLTAANTLVVATITLGEDGLPQTTARVVETLTGPALAAGTPVEVLNLGSAAVPGESAAPAAGDYLLPLVADGTTYRVAGLPRSPGYAAVDAPRPMIYRWPGDTQKQLRALGVGAK